MIGRSLPRASLQAAELAGFTIRRAHAGPYPILLRLAGRRVVGLLAAGLSARETARLDAYEGDGYRRARLPVLLADGDTVPAEVYLPRSRLRPAPGTWDLRTWQRYEKQAYLRRLGRTGRSSRPT